MTVINEAETSEMRDQVLPNVKGLSDLWESSITKNRSRYSFKRATFKSKVYARVERSNHPKYCELHWGTMVRIFTAMQVTWETKNHTWGRGQRFLISCKEFSTGCLRAGIPSAGVDDRADTEPVSDWLISTHHMQGTSISTRAGNIKRVFRGLVHWAEETHTGFLLMESRKLDQREKTDDMYRMRIESVYCIILSINRQIMKYLRCGT
jgi:hypothetical protein